MDSTTRNTLLLVAGVVCVMLCMCPLAAITTVLTPSRSTKTQTRPVYPTATEQEQTERAQLLAQCKRNNLFYKIEFSGSRPKVYVTAQWSMLNIDTKKNLAGVVWLYAFRVQSGSNVSEDGRRVHLLDYRTGEEVGFFSPRRGLVLDK